MQINANNKDLFGWNFAALQIVADNAAKANRDV